MAAIRLTKRLVESHRSHARDIILRDSEIKGFLCKITPRGHRVYMLYYRTKDGQERRPKIGVHGEITCDQARKIAQQWKAEVAAGSDPSAHKSASRQAPTVSQLCDRYLEEHAKGRKKPSSLRNDAQMIIRFIKPDLGARKVASGTVEDISRLHQRLRNTPYQANRLLALLAKMFSLAEAWGLRPNGSNPTRHVGKFREQKRQRYLTNEELERLGEVLEEAERNETEPPQIIAAIRLLLLTGCRLNEILALRWDQIDWDRGQLRFEDTKTGAQFRTVGAAVIEHLAQLPWRQSSPYVIPGRITGSHLVNLSKAWRRIRERAELNDVRIHDLRHTHASAAAGLGLSLPMIGKLLGHSQPATTARYAHLADDPVSLAATSVAEHIGNLMGRNSRP
jgi:integrase